MTKSTKEFQSRGLGVLSQLVASLGLDSGNNENVKVLKRHVRYHESDHVLTIAYNLGATSWYDTAIQLCRSAGFRKITLGGDTALDRWTDDGVRCMLGFRASQEVIAKAKAATGGGSD